MYASIGIHENARETYGRAHFCKRRVYGTFGSHDRNSSIPIMNRIGSEVSMNTFSDRNRIPTRNRRGGVVHHDRHVYTYSDWFGLGAATF